jgi:predicted phosphodiesterase
MAINLKTLEKYHSLVLDLGLDLAAKKIGITRESLRRNMRTLKALKDTPKDKGSKAKGVDENLMRQIRERYSDKELKALVTGSLHTKEQSTHIHQHNGDELIIGVMSDTHIGSKYTDLSHIDEAFQAFDDAGVHFITHSGDVFEGVSGRPGHVYELTEIGYHAQLEKGREIFKSPPAPIYFIDGNHDRWFIQSAGAMIVEELCRGNKDLTYLGHDEGNIILDPYGVKVRLWHGEDGSSRGHSYRVQCIIESLTGGDKPHVFIAGHTHKAFYVFERHIHCVSAGAIQSQSKWMRSKRLPSHTGFWIIRMTVNEKGVGRFSSEWFPFYV